MCILLVKDEFIVLKVAALVLLDAGHDVMTASDADEAYDHLDRYPGLFTCLVTDYQLPGEITGANVIDYMRNAYPSIPMILASAQLHAVADDWRAQHGVRLLQKPYDYLDLAGMVQRLIH